MKKIVYEIYQKQRRSLRPRVIILAAVILIAGTGGLLGLHAWYTDNLRPLSASSHQTMYFTVASGSSLNQIANRLQQAGLIRNARAFEIYARGEGLNASLQAGTYKLSPSMSSRQIVAKLSSGDVAKNLLTILPGQTISQIKQVFSKAGYKTSEINAAFNPAAYSDMPLVSTLPKSATLEGLLYPDSFQKQTGTPAKTIVRESLKETQSHLTSYIVGGFKSQGLNTFQGLTLASIVYKESGDPAAEPTIAQVFLRRLKLGMMLGSDVTAFYASEQAGLGKTLNVDSPYNTRLHTGLPPGPIGNFTADALKAVAHPAKTDYLYFVAGDNGVIHFSRTEAEFQQSVKKYCTKQCS